MNLFTCLVAVLFMLGASSIEAARPRLPLIEDVHNSPRRSSPQTQCSFGDQKDIYEVGEMWKPEGFNCIICECFQTPLKKKLVSRSHCKDIMNACPTANCEQPVLLPGRCCKTCGPNDTNIETELEMTKRMLLEDFAKTLSTARKEYYAVLAENGHKEDRIIRNHEVAENEAFLLLEGNRLSFVVMAEARPTFVRIQDENENIMEEYVVYGNSTQSDEFTIFGVWPKMTKLFKQMLRRGKLRFALSFDADPNADSSRAGLIRKVGNKRPQHPKYFEKLLAMAYRNDSELASSMLKTTAMIPLEERHNNGLRSFALADQSPLRQVNALEPSHKCYIEGQIYEDGALWKNQHDECEMCYCKRGRVECQTDKCLPPIGCKQPPVRVPGHCCPMCPDVVEQAHNQSTAAGVEKRPQESNVMSPSLNETHCFFQEKYHLVGSRWHPFLPPRGFDKCITCMCSTKLTIECNRKKCPELKCAESDAEYLTPMDCCKRCPTVMPTRSSMPAVITNEGLMASDQDLEPADEQKLQASILKKGGCKIRGTVKANGEQWSPIIGPFGENQCLRCTCKDGKHKCSRARKCPKLDKCKMIITKRDECCKICADPVPGKALRSSGRRSSHRFWSRRN